MKHYILYLPGLGDHKSRFQKYAVHLWRIFGVKGEFIPMHWTHDEPFAQKQQRVIDRIKDLHDKGYKVSLMGTSAGGGAGLNTFAVATDKLHKAVLVCGTIGGRQYYSEYTYLKNPAFRESMASIDDSLLRLQDADKQRILAIQPLVDPIVYPRFAVVPGANNRRMFTFGHVFSIAYAITLGIPKTIRFIKRA